MGDTTSSLTQNNDHKLFEQYMEKLQFVQNLQNPHFDSIQIYRMKQPPYQYIMDYKKTFPDGDNRLPKYMSCMQSLSKAQHKNLAKIHLTVYREEKQLCITDKKTHTFCNYYNFTLTDAIYKKKQQQAIFTQSELIYIMSCLVDLAQYLKGFGISIGQYHTGTTFLSPQGYVKIYILEVQQQNKHNCYYKVMCEMHTLENYILAPQQLKDLAKMQYDMTYDPYKADLFAIAFLVFELINQDDIKFYLNEQKNNYNFDRIHFDIQAVSKIYSQNFINLLKACLEEDPAKRCDLQQAGKILNSIKKVSPQCTYCIRLHDDQGKKKILSRKQSIQNSPKAPPVFGKLMPSPITTLSSSSSSFRGNNARNFNDLTVPNQIQQLTKSSSLTSKTSDNETFTGPGFMDKSVQKMAVFAQK